MNLLLLLYAALIALLAHVVFQLFICQLASIPGPLSAKFSRWWVVSTLRSGQFHRKMIEMHKRYGPVVRIAPDEISVADREAFKIIYGAGSKFRKANWYNVLQGGRKFDLFAEQDEAKHASQRRLVSRIYALDNLKNLEPYVDATIDRFVEKLKTLQGKEVDMGKWLQLFAFDVIGEITFAQPFGFLDAQQDDGIFNRINRSVKSGVWLAHVPWFYRLHNLLMPIMGNYLAINDREGTIRNYTVREVENRHKRGSDRPDILGRLFEIHDEKPSIMDRTSIVSVASANVGAGSDTTAISLRAIIHYLILNPEKMTKLLEEMDSMEKQGNLSKIVTFEQAQQMPYLQAVMYEAMRLYPAIGANLPRITPPGGFLIGKNFIPPGTIVGSSAWVIHRNQDIYGPDVDDFRPERWLEKDTGDLQRFFFSFGAGSRTCIGRNISWLEMSKLIPTLLQEFTLSLTNPEKPLHEDCSLFVLQTGLNMRLEPRKAKFAS